MCACRCLLQLASYTFTTIYYLVFVAGSNEHHFNVVDFSIVLHAWLDVYFCFVNRVKFFLHKCGNAIFVNCIYVFYCVINLCVCMFLGQLRIVEPAGRVFAEWAPELKGIRRGEHCGWSFRLSALGGKQGEHGGVFWF